MGYHFWSYETLKQLSLDSFQTFGFSAAESNIIQDVLLTADLFGIESHGIQRMSRYHQCIRNGMIQVDAKPEVVFETPLSAVIDGHDGMGQLIAASAMELAIQKAKQHGAGFVSVRNSNHYGIAGYYARMASRQGLIGFSTTNSEAIVVPTYGRKAMLGTNPLAFAFPAEPVDFLLDAATSVVTRGKLEVYNKRGEPLPDGWALDQRGLPSSDAGAVLSNIAHKAGGGIMPLGGGSELLGGHKGYGYAMLGEIFSSILSQGTTSDECLTGGRGGTCHSFVAIDPALFGDPTAIRRHFEGFLDKLRQAEKADGQDRIYIHGEKEAESVDRRLAEGIPVNDRTLAELEALCQDLSLPFSHYFGDCRPEVGQPQYQDRF